MIKKTFQIITCPQVYLEECKYKIKKIQMSRFINAELDSDDDSGDDSDDDSDK